LFEAAFNSVLPEYRDHFQKRIDSSFIFNRAVGIGGCKTLPEEQGALLCRTLNTILSGVIEEIPSYDIKLSRQAILAEIGTEIQGTWANAVGAGAAKAVEQLLGNYIDRLQIGRRIKKGQFALNNGWTIHFHPNRCWILGSGGIVKNRH